MKSLLKIFYYKKKAHPWFHPHSSEFWRLLKAVTPVNEGVEMIFEGHLTRGPSTFLSRLLTNEQKQVWLHYRKLKRSRPNEEELPWYHPNNDCFWGQVFDIRKSAHRTELVFLGSALHDDFRVFLRDKGRTVLTPGGNFLLTARELIELEQDVASQQEELVMLKFWASKHPELANEVDWRSYICEQARIACELEKKQDELKTLINSAFNPN